MKISLYFFSPTVKEGYLFIILFIYLFIYFILFFFQLHNFISLTKYFGWFALFTGVCV